MTLSALMKPFLGTSVGMKICIFPIFSLIYLWYIISSYWFGVNYVQEKQKYCSCNHATRWTHCIFWRDVGKKLVVNVCFLDTLHWYKNVNVVTSELCIFYRWIRVVEEYLSNLHASPTMSKQQVTKQYYTQIKENIYSFYSIILIKNKHWEL